MGRIMMQWFAQAPSNIALIKYMGKIDAERNIPANPSLSYTLPNLITNVKLEARPGKKDFWEPLEIPGADIFQLSSQGQKRYIDHLAMLKDYFEYEGAFVVRSSNNFPHSSGLASSASSFAALTKCACLALSELTPVLKPSIQTQAALSRLGSGSSCRSFFSPWALWNDNQVQEMNFEINELAHQVIIISHDEKNVASSKAHELIKKSHGFEARVERANQNLTALINALEIANWESIFEICWREFQDMHRLFTQATPSFSYMTEQTDEVLTLLKNHWDKTGDGPIVTMDAGPNIHMLYRPEQKEQALQFKRDYLVGNYDVLGF
jgi:diphosphomevalonate decarboxylase